MHILLVVLADMKRIVPISAFIVRPYWAYSEHWTVACVCLLSIFSNCSKLRAQWINSIHYVLQIDENGRFHLIFMARYCLQYLRSSSWTHQNFIQKCHHHSQTKAWSIDLVSFKQQMVNSWTSTRVNFENNLRYAAELAACSDCSVLSTFARTLRHLLLLSSRVITNFQSVRVFFFNSVAVQVSPAIN